MIHLLLGMDPAGIRRIPSEPRALAFPPVDAAELGWPGMKGAQVHSIPAAGGWVGGDIMAGAVRAGFSRSSDGIGLYVDLGTNGEIVVGGAEFALACACGAGPAFEGGGIRCGMRADRGAVDGASIDEEKGTLRVSIIGGGRVRGVCGSGLIALSDALYRAGWIDRSGRFTSRLPAHQRVEGKWGLGMAISEDSKIALWERDIASLIRAKAAVFAGIRSLLETLGGGVNLIERAIVSGNFGRFLNLPAAVGIGLLPGLQLGRYGYVDNGSLEGAALGLLSREFFLKSAPISARSPMWIWASCPDTWMSLSALPSSLTQLPSASSKQYIAGLSTQILRFYRILNYFPGPCVLLAMGKPSKQGIEFHQGIRIDKIPVEGIPGLMFMFATVFMFAASIPAVREFLLITSIPGIIGAGVLYYWHNQTRW